MVISQNFLSLNSVESSLNRNQILLEDLNSEDKDKVFDLSYPVLFSLDISYSRGIYSGDLSGNFNSSNSIEFGVFAFLNRIVGNVRLGLGNGTVNEKVVTDTEKVWEGKVNHSSFELSLGYLIIDKKTFEISPFIGSIFHGLSSECDERIHDSITNTYYCEDASQVYVHLKKWSPLIGINSSVNLHFIGLPFELLNLNFRYSLSYQRLEQKYGFVGDGFGHEFSIGIGISGRQFLK